jgi:thiol-disulfide isomerase/thioredoxin
MDYLNQIKQSASGIIGGGSTNESGGLGKMIMYAVVIALFAAVSYWVYTTYLAPALSNGNASLKQGASGVEGDETAADGAIFDDAPIAELYLFKTDWCPHCKRALPIFESLKQEYDHKLVNGHRVLFRVVDCEQEPKIADKFKIEGYPTIKLVKDDQVIEYDAKPEKEHLVQFMSTVI